MDLFAFVFDYSVERELFQRLSTLKGVPRSTRDAVEVRKQ